MDTKQHPPRFSEEQDARHEKYCELFGLKMEELTEAMTPVVDELAERMARSVVSFPELASTYVDMGNFDLQYPSEQEAVEYIAELEEKSGTD